MKVNSITVNAGRTFNHPFESYSNLRPSVTFTASLEDGEDFEACAKELQAKAESLIEEHKATLLNDIRALQRAREVQRDIALYEERLERMKSELDKMREEAQSLPLLQQMTPTEIDEEHHYYE